MMLLIKARLPSLSQTYIFFNFFLLFFFCYLACSFQCWIFSCFIGCNCGRRVNGLWLKTYSFSAASLQCFVIVETSINDGVSCAQTTAWHSRLIRSDKIASTVKKISGNDHAVIYIANPGKNTANYAGIN